MLGLFTDPYPDEILYSAIARYHERVRYRGTATTLCDLFGVVGVRVPVDLPSRLNQLVSRLPPNHSYTVDYLIDEHTLLPYFAPFLQPVRVARLREAMSGNGGQSIYGRLGSQRRLAPVVALQYCPVCFEEDGRAHGEPYWHRVHQAPGIVACPEHAVFLESSGISFHRRLYRNSLVTARQAIPEPEPARQLDLGDSQHRVHLRLAKDAAWLFRQKGLSLESLRRRYLKALYERSLASHTGRVIHLSALRRLMDEFYTPEFLNSLSCGFTGRAGWLEFIFRRTARSQPVLCHLLLINFLGYSAEELCALPQSDEPLFGQPPFPCLNAAADHYRELRIAQCQPERKLTPAGWFKATFACPDCGFTYRRYGREEAGGRQYRFDRVLHFGEVWDEALRTYLASADLSETRMAARLGVSLEVLQARIRRMGLRGRGGGTACPLGRQKDSDALIEAKRTRNRAAWLRALDQNPGDGRRAVGRRVPSAYRWLLSHDGEWFTAHAPALLRSPGGRSKYDWEHRDAELALKAVEMIERLKSQHGRPVRASKTAVMRELKALDLMTKKGYLIPRTLGVLDRQAESAEEFAVRRIERVTRSLLEEKVRAPRWLIIHRAAVARIGHVPAVREAIDRAVECLERACVQGWEPAA